MKSQFLFKLLPLLRGTGSLAAPTSSSPSVTTASGNVTYQGLERNGIELFLNIPYGQDTSGENRFKPPRPYVPAPGTTVNARSYGPACPQPLGPSIPPLVLSNVTEISEDCLNLNVARPRGACPGDRLPVAVFIHGGSFWTGQNSEITTAPDGMILESIENGLPIIHVAMNYRLGSFGFAQSDALKSEGSENAGLRDQRLAIEWVRDNIEQFGGDPERVTIFGQSSGGLAVGLHIMAYGASKPVPFQQAICESQALEPGITGNFTIDAMQLLVEQVGCNTSSLHSEETVSCLRDLDMDTLLNASIATYQSDIAHNIGDIWLPAVDGDFLPAAPSQLIREGRLAHNITAMMLWCEDDVTFFTDTSIATADDTRAFVRAYAPGLSDGNLDALLALYPVADFTAKELLSAEFYRAARVLRDVLMACEPLWYARHLAAYLVDWNQTLLAGPLEHVYGAGFGVVHTSEFAYVFANLSHYDTMGYPFDPAPADYALARRGSRSWSTFVSTGRPGLEEGGAHDTFKGFGRAFPDGDGADAGAYVFVAGGPDEGLSAISGPGAKPAVGRQKLAERCAFINSPEVIEQLGF
ncbi:putative lipase [Biscogniauxia mediterranea]|nr:putative lipase [Biscogniauxia mediterranea]